jgi:hypothetical protein
MIHQIAPVPTKTTALPSINKALIKARHIQARVRGDIQAGCRPESGVISSPLSGAPFLVPILRWIE